MIFIGNKGSFAKEIIEELGILSNSENLNYYLIDKKLNPGISIERVIDWLNSLGKITEPIVFVGGETKKEDRMYMMNVTLPYYLYLIAHKFNVRFIYLSSLSVFGIPYSTKVDFNSKVHPQDLYGKTKNLLDKLIFSSKNNLVSAIYPGSMVTKNRPNFLLTIHKIRDMSPLRMIFKFFPFVGGITISNINNVAAYIYRESSLLNESPQNKIICAEFVPLDKISDYLDHLGIKPSSKSVKPIFKLNTLPLSFVRTISIFLSYKARRRFLFMLKPIIYSNK